ncbi:MAG: AMP-binding protein [Rhodobacteraceae bacterium]|nr:AMP-binding protein [Paracoccaceae bacterium]
MSAPARISSSPGPDGGANLPRPFESVVHMLAEAAGTAPDREALVCGAVRLSYAAYAGAVEGVARLLVGAGAGPGTRVALILPNGPDLAIGIYAAMATGAQAVPLNPAYTLHELGPILEDAAPTITLAAPALAARLAPLMARLHLPEALAVGPGGLRLDEVAGDADGLPLPPGDGLGLLQYTGGTTGRPKGVESRHSAFALNVSQRDALVPTRLDAERTLIMTPLYHVYATAMGLYLAAHARGTMVLLPSYSAEAALEAVERERITFFAGSPTIYHGLLNSPALERTDFATLECCFSGSAALPEATLAAWARATGASICEGYGQTEGGPVLATNPRSGPHKPGSVGVAVPGTELRIVDPADPARDLPAGEVGEILARGPQLMEGYRNRPEETAEALRGGWLHTGDLGCLDSEGYLSIRDRKKDMVVVSGYNVFPREIEEALLSHPAVHEAAAFGLPHPRKGEVVAARVVAPGADPEDLRAHLAERLVRYKLPAEIVLVADLPRTPVGKTDKAALRRAVLEGRA